MASTLFSSRQRTDFTTEAALPDRVFATYASNDPRYRLPQLVRSTSGVLVSRFPAMLTTAEKLGTTNARRGR
jgi:hypothetical protein